LDRLFLDANVLFSAAYGSRGIEGLWKQARQGHVRLLASSYVVEEAIRNLPRPEQLAKLKELPAELTIVPEAHPGMSCPVKLPLKDVPVLTAAVQARATHLITGDLNHFGIYRGETIQGVHVCTPGDYLNRLQAR